MTQLNREALIQIVEQIMDADGTDAELDNLMLKLEASVPHPAVSDLIFWPKNNKEPTAAEVVDEALAYRPITAPHDG